MLLRNKKSGLTLIETLIAITVTTVLILMTAYWYIQTQRKERAVGYGKDLVSIVTAFDKRIQVDGFDSSNLKNGTTWANSTAFLSMLSTEFIAKEASCGKTNGWVPALPNEKTTRLISCNLWTQIPYGMTATAKIEVDSNGFIQNFFTILKFANTADFNDNFTYLNTMRLTANNFDSSDVTGGHSYYFANNNDTATKITNAACLTLKSACVLVAQYGREGGYEYLRVDGTNSMLNSAISFKESKGSNRQQCLKWFQNTTGAWTSNMVDCGIGIYTKTGYPISVDVASNGSTQSRVMLDKSCDVYTTSGSQVAQSGTTTPCGIMRVGAGTEIYQVVDSLSAKLGYVQTIYTSTLVSDQVNTQYATIYKNLTVNGDTYLKSTLTVDGIAVLKSNVTVGGNIGVNGNAGVNGTINSGQSITANTGNITASGGDLNAPQGSVNAVNGHFSNNVNTNTFNASGRSNFGEYVYIQGNAGEGNGCGPNGLVGRTSEGRLLSCVNGSWQGSAGMEGDYIFQNIYTRSMTYYNNTGKAIYVTSSGGNGHTSPSNPCSGRACGNSCNLQGIVSGISVAYSVNNNTESAKSCFIGFWVPRNKSFIVDSQPWTNATGGSFVVTIFGQN